MADKAKLQKAIQDSSVGKKMPGSIYVHRTALMKLPKLLLEKIARAQKALGHEEGNIIKFEIPDKVSFLTYMGFHEMAHPHLVMVTNVKLVSPPLVQSRDHWDRPNRHILHRKELMVADDYPDREMFEKLSLAEIDAGLLGRADIGYENQWEALLQQKGLKIVGHQLTCV